MRTLITSDPDSYDRPYVEIRRRIRAERDAAALPPEGAADRMIGPQDRIDALARYDARLQRLVAEGRLNHLPCPRHGERILADTHVLEEGPFRGVFLVDLPGQYAYAMLFSMEPHDGSLIETLREARALPALARWRSGR